MKVKFNSVDAKELSIDELVDHLYDLGKESSLIFSFELDEFNDQVVNTKQELLNRMKK